MVRKSVLTAPLFIVGIFILLLNDHYFKATYGNWFTGKLSDVSGLFVFPLFLSAFMFKNRIFWCYVLTGLIFVFWKLPLSNFLIDFFNWFGITIARTVDYSDLFALFILPFSYLYQKQGFKTIGLIKIPMLMISVFAFVATTLPPQKKVKYVNIDKTYNFDFSKDELIGKLNKLSAQKISKAKQFQKIRFNSETDVFYSKWNGDTLAVMLDSKKLSVSDTIQYKTVLADFVVEGNDSTSTLKFITAYKTVPESSDKDYRQKAIRHFERKVIKKLIKKEFY